MRASILLQDSRIVKVMDFGFVAPSSNRGDRIYLIVEAEAGSNLANPYGLMISP